MQYELYQVDAFTDTLFGGNPAAVCLIDQWIEEQTLQRIAAENNLAETAFIAPKEQHWEIRWFTPAVEVDLCGHATLAAAHVLFRHKGYTGESIRFFSSRSGNLHVRNNGDTLTLDFPTDTYKACELTGAFNDCFPIHCKEAYKGKTDYLLIFDTEDQIKNLQPNLAAIEKLDARGLIVSAPGSSVDFVSRFFAPQSGINEDPVTGSAHTSLTPYWAKRLKKKELTAIQLSSRTGFLECELRGDRVAISGSAVTYLIGTIVLPD